MMSPWKQEASKSIPPRVLMFVHAGQTGATTCISVHHGRAATCLQTRPSGRQVPASWDTSRNIRLSTPTGWRTTMISLKM